MNLKIFNEIDNELKSIKDKENLLLKRRFKR